MEKAGDLLRLFFDGKQFAEGRKWTAFFHAWERILGEKLAHHSRIRDVKNGAVIVEVDHPGWIQMLQIKQRDILAEIERSYPDLNIKALHIQLSEQRFRTEEVPGVISRESDAVDPEEAGADRLSAPPEAEEGVPGAVGLEGIRDENFRELLERLEKSIRKKNRERARSSRIDRSSES